MRHLSTATLLLVIAWAMPPAAGFTPQSEPAAVVVIEKAGDSMWTATWRLAEPARELRFEAPAAGFRARVFEVLTPGYRLERDGDVDVLRTDGAPAREIAVRFPEYDAQLTREYEFFRRFTDGSVAIYTGHLVARPITAAGAAACDDCYIRRFEMVPPAGAAVVVSGRRTEGRTVWTDTTHRGTYVYVGAITPVASQDVISVIDPGLPDWLEARTREALPRLFALYRERFDAALPARPVVLFDYEAGTTSGYSNGGGTLPGLIQLSVQGRAWARESEGALQQFLHLLAHESAHVWNGEIAHYDGTEDAWMHEGSADAFAERALARLGVIDEARFLEYQTAALNDCRRALTLTSLRPSAARGQPRMAYTCGNVIALVTETSLQRSGVDLFAFWRRLIARAGAHGGKYTADDYRAVLRELKATDADVAVLDSFLDGTMDPDAIAGALEARGLTLSKGAPPPSYAQSVGRDVFARLMSTDCNGRVGFRPVADGLLLDRDVACSTLTPASVVIALEGFDVLRDGHRAYDAVRVRCESDKAVTLAVRIGDAERRDVQVACGNPLPPRPAYMSITARPAIRRPRLSSSPRGFAPRTPLHASSLAASPARSGRVARSRRSLAQFRREVYGMGSNHRGAGARDPSASPHARASTMPPVSSWRAGRARHPS